MVAIDNLDHCKSYWVVVTAVDCVNHVQSSPVLIGLFESLRFKFEMSLDDGALCRTWISSDLNNKLSAVEQLLVSTIDSSCKMRVSCVASSLFTCGRDLNIVTYE